MLPLRLGDGEIDGPVADLAALQRRGHRLEERPAIGGLASRPP
jgi:hypothetical protein